MVRVAGTIRLDEELRVGTVKLPHVVHEVVCPRSEAVLVAIVAQLPCNVELDVRVATTECNGPEVDAVVAWFDDDEARPATCSQSKRGVQFQGE